jgi:FkbM family methyltransferase
MFWLRKIVRSKHKLFLIKKAWKLKSFRFLRELYYSIKHPEEKDLLLLPLIGGDPNRQVVFVDIGAFEGDFTLRMFQEYPNSKAYLVEPVPEFLQILKSRFQSHNIILIEKALSANGKTIKLSDEGASSSEFSGKKSRSFQSISVMELSTLIKESYIDLFQINCEGGEYEILPELIDTDIIKKIGALNIQFHYLNPRNIYLRYKITKKLKSTHQLKWCVQFIWDRWERKSETL